MKNIIISTGGSGGHVFPAITIANSLIDAGHKVNLVFDARSSKFVKQLDLKLLNSFHIIPISKYKSGLVFKLQLLFTLMWATLTTFFYFHKIKPQQVISFGSYATVPTLICAVLLRIPIYLHEQNAVLGKVNKFFFRFAKKVFLSFPNTYNIPGHYKNKIVITGNPIRKNHSFSNIPSRDSKEFVITVIGGSQGAKVMATVIPAAIKHLQKKPTMVYHQVRAENLAIVEKFYRDMNINAKVATFFDDIADIMQKSSLIISRAGASTIFEILEYKKPAILLPYPYAADNHQYFNAKFLIDNNLAEIFDEKKQSSMELSNTIASFDAEKMQQIPARYDNIEFKFQDILQLLS